MLSFLCYTNTSKGVLNMKFGFWLPIFGGWLRNVENENMPATFEYAKQAYRIVEKIEVIGGCNCQFAHDPVSDRIVCIEINPRTSRSSALASKATGFPIALVSAMLAAGLTLDEMECGKYGTQKRYISMKAAPPF